MQREATKKAEATVGTVKEKQTKQTEYSEPEVYLEDFVAKKIVPAETLPEGWKWAHYDDGSGHLESPDGKSYFSYDLCTCYNSQGGVEHKDIKGEWTVFWGTFSDFKKHAENVIMKEFFLSIESDKDMSRLNKDKCIDAAELIDSEDSHKISLDEDFTVVTDSQVSENTKEINDNISKDDIDR